MALDHLNQAKRERYRQRFPEIFWARVDKSGGEGACWPYTGATRANGYGRLRIEGRYELAHRVAYRLANGQVPSDMFVCHSCDNPICCNPSHLWLGDHADNMADRQQKGRYATGEQHPQSRLTLSQAAAIMRRAMAGETAIALAAQHGVHYSTIRRLITSKRWAALKATLAEMTKEET
jgi:hypothetical protein